MSPSPCASNTTFLLAALMMCGCSKPSIVAKKDAISPIAVKTVAVQEVNLARTTRQPATVEAFFEAKLRARVQGYVVHVLADIGDVVQAGQVVAQIDVPELQKQSLVLEAQLNLLAAKEQGATAGVELAEAAVRAAKAKLEQTKSEQAQVAASLAAAEAEFDRTQDLVNRGSLQSRILDEARKKRDAELASQSALASAVVSAEAEVGVAEAKRAASEATLATAQAETQVKQHELEELQVQLAFAEIKAPFHGIITERHVDLGDLVNGTPGGDTHPLFVLSQTDTLRVRIEVPEVEAPFVQPGDKITLEFPSFASEPAIQASVTRRAGRLDPSTRTMTVEASLENSDGRLLPGMFGQATIELDAKVATKVLPSRAVRFDESGRAFVYLVGAGDQVQRLDVTTGQDTGTEIEILSGLQSGDVVIGPHLKRFSNGQLVRPL